MSIYYKYAPDGTQIVVLYYVYDCAYWYTSKDLGKWFVDALEKRFRATFLLYAHWFMPILINQIRDNSISIYQDRYYTSIVEKYLHTNKVKTSKTFYNNTLPYDIIFTKADASTSDD